MRRESKARSRAASVGDFAKARRAEDALVYRIGIEELVASIATRFLDLSTDQLDEGIQEALRLIGEFCGVDRSYVFQVSEDQATVSNTHEWCAKGIPPTIQNFQDFPRDHYSWIAQKLLRLETVHVRRTAEFPPEAAAERAAFALLDTQSLILVPMARGRTLVGLVGFDSVRAEKTWPEEDIRLLRLIARVFVAAIERRRTDAQLRDSREELRNLYRHLQSVREEERARIAREVHDELGHALAALKIDLTWLDHRLPAAVPGAVEKVHAMLALTDRTITAVQRISTELRPGILDHLGLGAAIEWQAEEFQRRTGVVCDIRIDARAADWPPGLSTALFRIFQEALTNVARHAAATRVWIRLSKRRGAVKLTVKDNGRGITPEQVAGRNSLGLIGIRERVHSLGGEADIRGVRGKSTTVKVTIPLTQGDLRT